MSKCRVIKFQAPFERLKEYDLAPEVRLHKAIITQAIIDVSGNSDTNSSKKIEIEAKNWLFGDSQYFRDVCFRAELLPQKVMQMARDAIRMNKKRLELAG
jgi:hypothetical protein